MTEPSARAVLDTHITEKQFSQRVVDYAVLKGWLVYRTPTWRPTGSYPGFPDLVLTRPGDSRVIFLELKSEKGRVSAAQTRWLDTLGATLAIASIVKPSDWHLIEALLR